MVKKITCFAVVVLAFMWVPKVFAAGEFATSYDVLYDVSDSGTTTVTEKITLKNLTSQYYANQFKLTIGSTKVSDIKAADPGGVLDVTQEQIGISTTLATKFNQQVVGLGKSLAWTLSFTSQDFAEKIGKVWEVRVPKISSTANLEDYNLTVAVPESFGHPSSISPTPDSESESEGKIFLTFDKNQLETSGVSAIFGDFQIFDFDLTYHLANNNLMPVLTNITLPPDTSYQDVIYQRIDPKPLNVTVDADGNYLAWYQLNRRQKIDVKAFGSAKLYTVSKVKRPLLDGLSREKYITPQKYWESNNPQIVNKLAEILGDNPPADSEGKAKLIFQYVVNSLKYDPGRLKDSSTERLGAVTVLDNPNSAVCMEFTDLFIALSRAASIPARELDGYAYTGNTTLRPLSLAKDILHAWPEYWNDQRGWVMVDPTWENTTGGVDYFNKLDLNHFVFAIKGISSQEPIPAGSYKYQGQDSQDIKVSLSEVDFLGKPQIDVSTDVPNPILAGFPSIIKVTVTNTGNAVFPSASIQLSANKLFIAESKGQQTGLIPPYGHAEFDFDVHSKSLFDSYNDQIVINVGDEKFTKDVVVQPFIIFFQPVPVMVAGLTLLMALIYFTVLSGHIYRKKLKKKPAKKS